MSEQREIVEKCLHRIAAKYARRGKPELWTDDTCEEFLRAFAMIPVSLLPSVVDEGVVQRRFTEGQHRAARLRVKAGATRCRQIR